ncbi:MAG TPA: alpha/beta hydrolase [Candidatus Dormibacteraeota bacterium]|nr:alpha/beta hydrolase [Candidatus Dormibacteraeota bacterium]
MPLDPRARRFLDRLAASNPQDASGLTAEARRAALAELLNGLAGPTPAVARVEERTVAGPAGSLALRIYTPANAAADILPGFIYFHGGGFVAGSLDTHDGIARSLANACGARLLSVDYRLGPEHRFPAAVEDGCAAARWVAAHARELGLDPTRLALCGDSAGATLATVVCHITTSERSVGWALQLLLCPILDFCAATPSRSELARGYFLEQATLDHDLRHYLPSGADPSDPRVSPLRARELRGLPPSCIHTAEFDPLRDEGRDYAQRLEAAGVRTLYRCHSGMIHLFYGMGALIPYAATAYRLIGEDVRAILG